MFDIEQFEDGGSIIGDGRVLGGRDHLVHASGTCLVQIIPRVDFTMSTTASMALMFEMICPIPYMESVPSLSRRMVGCLVMAVLLRGATLI